MSRKIEVSEIFMSLEGEGPHSNHPTAYVRASRCNFKCAGFNNPDNVRCANGYAPITFDPTDYASLSMIPLVDCGCDSQYSVNPEFAHMWTKMTMDEIAERLVEMLPHNSWVHPTTGTPVILSLTGGEPTLHWKAWPELMNHPLLDECRHILIETNCAVPLNSQFVMEINSWLSKNRERKWTWSNSPKLSASGESWEDAIRPEIAVKQRWVTGVSPSQVEQYFKFVVEPEQQSVDEVMRAMEEYYAAGVPRNVQIWAMPMACSEEQQQQIARSVATMCLEHGFLYSHRIQNSLWGNGVGT